MRLRQRLAAAAERIDARLEALLYEGAPVYEGAPGADDMCESRLGAAMRHAVLAGGKRFRPFLVLETAGLFGLAPSRAEDAAAALECIHCYSLVHDDLPAMDNDELRRGHPTVWKAYDEWTAILVGDALQALAFDILSRPSTHPDPAVRCELVQALARASGAAGMTGGQSLDLAAEKLLIPPRPDAAHLTRIHAGKTGALIACACEFGAILAGATAPERDALKRYGRAIGLAFQIADDLLDAEGDAATVGKATGKDDAAGKATFVATLGVPAARAALVESQAEAVAALSMFADKAHVLLEAARFVVERRA